MENFNHTMTRIISISNQKGGVGKTTSTLNIGAALALKGKRVLLVDMDPQCNLTKSLGADKGEQDIYGVLLKEYSVKSAVFKIRDNLLLIPGSKNFPAFERNHGGEFESFFYLKEQLDELLARVEIDFVLIDCPPSLNLISTNAYVASKEIIVPLEAQEFSLDGLDLVSETLRKVNKRLNPGLKIVGAFFSRYHHRKLISREICKIIEQEYPDILIDNHIRECVQLKESPSYKKDVFSYAPESNGAKDYMNLAIEIEKLCPGNSI